MEGRALGGGVIHLGGISSRCEGGERGAGRGRGCGSYLGRLSVGGWGERDVVGGGPIGDQSAVADRALLPFPLVLLSCLDVKIKKCHFCEQVCKGQVDSKEVESKWLKGGSHT